MNTNILSIQLYTLRSLGDLDSVLDIVKQAGYGHVETIGSHLDDTENVRAKLDARDLKVSSSHVSLAALRERLDVVVQACHTLGFEQLFMPAVSPEQRQGDAPFWRTLGRELGELAERLRDEGITLGYHNHHWELAPKEGTKTALELLFEAAEGSPLAWQVDVAWLVRGGADPKAWMERARECDFLDQAVDFSQRINQRHEPEDYSYVLRPALEQLRYIVDNVRGMLVSAVCTAAEQVAEQDPARIPARTRSVELTQDLGRLKRGIATLALLLSCLPLGKLYQGRS
ncbi:MAG: TIM barrel protein [Verrucomicrobia bacterium]|nr:TIM barrel protein [Verrucomicrobiota bacterium]